MKFYWPIALVCSVVGCIIFMPIAYKVPADQIFIGVQYIGYALASGGMMAWMLRKFYGRASYARALGMAIPFGFLHVGLFGMLVGLTERGIEGAAEGFVMAPYWTLLRVIFFIPLCLGASAAIKWAAGTEVEDISIFDS